MDEVLEALDKVVTDGMNKELLQPFVGEEVHTALFQMHPSKSPGPDGMSPFFFQKFWHIIGGDVTKALLSVLNSSHVLNKMNFTHILLIPKKKDPQCMADYQPIGLSNVVSRIVSKVLANQVKPILPNIISDSQSAFVPNRLISDNTSVAYEMLHRLRNRRQGKVGHMVIKLDISKAYNKVEWEFLRKIMLKMGFSDRWVNLAMQGVSSASYSMLINGEPRGLIHPTRGIKQGDQLSPYLFLFCVKRHFGMLRKPIEAQHTQGIMSC